MSNADQVILDDLIVDGSICAGLDCVNGESFGFDTLRLKENNLRIKFDDTSSTGSFPNRDWQLTANDTANGGANKFSIDDITGGRTPFTVEAAARTNALYVESDGDIGIGTANPVVDLHIVTGNTPTLRLEQDGSSGFTSQTWDVAGNETNFFVRDATHGSTLPFRIRPGAPSSAIHIAADGDVGIGTSSPGAGSGVTDASVHIRRTDGAASLYIEEANATAGFKTMLEMANNAGGGMGMRFNNGGTSIDFNNSAGQFRINHDDGDSQELSLDAAGNLTVTGTVTTATQTLPDYVFEPDYALMPLNELETFITENKHLPNIPSKADVKARQGQYNMTEMQMKLLEKVEELTLYTLTQQKTITELQAKLAALE